MKGFLADLATHGSSSVSAERAGVNVTTVYRYRKSSATFAKAWELALERAADRMEAEVHRRAVEGVQRKKFHQGEPIMDPVTGAQYIEREFSDTLLMFRLKSLRPDKYRDNAQTNVNVSTSVAITISEPERQLLIERRRMALGGAN